VQRIQNILYEYNLTDVLNSEHNLHWESNTQLTKQPQKRDREEEGVVCVRGREREREREKRSTGSFRLEH
jgi:hypothetical protein